MTQSRKGSPTSRAAPRTGRRVGGPAVAAALSQLRRRRRERGAPCHIDWRTQPLNLTSWSCSSCPTTPGAALKPWQILVTIRHKYSNWFGQILFLLPLNQVWCGWTALSQTTLTPVSENNSQNLQTHLLQSYFLRFEISDSGLSLFLFHQFNRRFHNKNTTITYLRSGWFIFKERLYFQGQYFLVQQRYGVVAYC